MVRGLTFFPALSPEGHHVAWVRDGQTALASCRDRTPDVVIATSTLPPTGGLALCTQLRANSRVPILVLSTTTDIDDCVAWLEAGADDYLHAPFGRRELAARMTALLWRVRRRDA